MQISKTAALKLVDEMPESFDLEELQYRLYLHQKLEAAEADIANGHTFSHDEVLAETESWFRK